MSQLRFLCDEDVSHDVIAFLRSAEPALDLLAIGEAGAPPKHTADSVVYRAAVTLGRTLISGDKKTMKGLVTADLLAGGHNYGAIFLRSGHSVASYATTIHLIWYCESTNDWLDRIDYIPY
jgi:hypothetical protein